MVASSKIAEAYVDIKAKTGNYEKKVKGIKSSLFSLGNIAKGGALALGIFVGVKVLQGIKSVTTAFNDEEKTVAKLNAVLKATGGAAGYSSEELQKQASALQNVTTFSNDAIINTQAILATFKNVSGENFKGATEAILDMSTVLGQDAKQGAIQLGKALNDPAKGITALSRVGVTFTEGQKKMIKELSASGDMIGAQGIILKELQSEFGGAAKAMRKTFGGSIKGLANDLQDFGKMIINMFGSGKGISSALNNFGAKIRKVTEKFGLLAKTDKFKRFLINMKFIFKELGIRISAPFKIQIAIFRDFFDAIYKYVIEPNLYLIKFFGSSGLSWADEMVATFGKLLPNSMKHTKTAINDVMGSLQKIKIDKAEALANIGKLGEKDVARVRSQEKEKQEALKKTDKVRFGGIDLIRKAAQEAALKVKVDSNDVAPIKIRKITPTAGSVNNTADQVKTSLEDNKKNNKVPILLKDIINTIKISNQILSDILNKTDTGTPIIV